MASVGRTRGRTPARPAVSRNFIIREAAKDKVRRSKKTKKK